MRKFKWYDWIPIVGLITTHWGRDANGYCHFETLLWFAWIYLSSIFVSIFVVVGILFLLTLF